MGFIENYNKNKEERAKLNVPPLPLSVKETAEVIELIKANNSDVEFLVDLLENRVNPGVDDSAYVKAAFLNDVVQGNVKVGAISPMKAIDMLGKMLGGYNVKPLVEALKNDNKEVAELAGEKLKNTLLVYDSFNDVAELSKTNDIAKSVIESWANAEWFINRPELPEKIKVTVFKVPGETNTDDLSPASEAFTRSDIPLHANSMLGAKMENPLETIAELKKKGNPVAYVGDVVGTGSSRKSGINSVQWHLGEDIDGVPNKRTKGIVIGSIIAPIFFNTAEDSGALPIEADVTKMETGDVLEIDTKAGTITKNDEVIANFKLNPNTIADEYRAGGRIPLIIGRGLTTKAREFLGMPQEEIFAKPEQPADSGKGYTLAQKMVGKACGMKGVRPGMYCEPITTTVGSQDTTGPMTRDEIKELAALSFGGDMVMQSFCHTAAYPKPSDVKLFHTYQSFGLAEMELF